MFPSGGHLTGSQCPGARLPEGRSAPVSRDAGVSRGRVRAPVCARPRLRLVRCRRVGLSLDGCHYAPWPGFDARSLSPALCGAAVLDRRAGGGNTGHGAYFVLLGTRLGMGIWGERWSGGPGQDSLTGVLFLLGTFCVEMGVGSDGC